MDALRRELNGEESELNGEVNEDQPSDETFWDTLDAHNRWVKPMAGICLDPISESCLVKK